MLWLTTIFKYKQLIMWAGITIAAIGAYWWFMNVLDERDKLRTLVEQQKIVIESQTKQIAKERLAFQLSESLNLKLEQQIKALEDDDILVIESLAADDLDEQAPESVREFLDKIR